MKHLFLFALIILSNTLFAQEPPEKYQKLWQEMMEGQPSTAQVKELKKIAKNAPNDPWPYWMLGIALFQGEPTEEVRDCFKKSFEADPNFAPAHYNYASSLDETDSTNYPTMELHYTKAIELDPTENHYYVARAGVYQAQQKFNQAIVDCETAKKINGEDVYFANRIIIECLHEQDKTDELKTFLESNDPNAGGGPEDPSYHYLLATIYESFGDKADACMEYKQALSDQAFYREMFGEEEGFKDPDWYETVLHKLDSCE